MLKDRSYRYSQLFLEKEIKRAYVPSSELKMWDILMHLIL